MYAIIYRDPVFPARTSRVCQFALAPVIKFCGGLLAHSFLKTSYGLNKNIEAMRELDELEIKNRIFNVLTGANCGVIRICQDEEHAVFREFVRIWLGHGVTNGKAAELHLFDTLHGQNPIENTPIGTYEVPEVMIRTAESTDVIFNASITLERREFKNHNSGNMVHMTQLIYNGRV